MSDILIYINKELSILEGLNKHNRTGEIRKVSKKAYIKIKELTYKEKLIICEKLLMQRKWAMWIIAFDIAFRQRSNYTIETFTVFERWLIEYIRDWDDCDDFCVHALGALIADYPELFDRVKIWCDSPNFWVRRAAAVCLIYSIRINQTDKLQIFDIADKLLNDEHYLVVKGYGWMLKEYSVHNKQQVIDYLKDNARQMPRVSFRYALEKMDGDTRDELMKL